jgi:uroporphyrinogen decarboxylase
MTERENYLRCVRFQGPEWIPCSLGTLPAVWKRHRMDLVQLALEYPEFFGPINPAGWDFDEMGFRYAQGRDETDNWGVVWRNQHEGVVGLPWVHPLADLKALATYQAPDPLTMDPLVGPRDFVAEAESFRQAQAEGRPAVAYVGTLFERLQELVGMENLLVNLASADNPDLQAVVDLVAGFDLAQLRRTLELGTPDLIRVSDDLGTQRAAMVSPRTFRRWLKPSYAALYRTARAAGCETTMHSDGYLLELVDDLLDAGLTVLNPQVGPNTLAGIRDTMKGRLAISLDLDRQHILPHGTPEDIRDHIREAVAVLSAPEGGLMLQAEVNGDYPLENIRAICAGLREVQGER